LRVMMSLSCTRNLLSKLSKSLTRLKIKRSNHDAMTTAFCLQLAPKHPQKSGRNFRRQQKPSIKTGEVVRSERIQASIQVAIAPGVLRVYFVQPTLTAPCQIWDGHRARGSSGLPIYFADSGLLLSSV
jgi:hypothetical protein